MRDRLARSLVLAAGALLCGLAPAREEAAAPLPRTCAEWEPALGTLIAWPLALPRDLVVELAREARLYVLVKDGPAEEDALDQFEEWGIDLTRVEIIPSTVQTCWTRDYGMHLVFGADGVLRGVDPIYIDTPMFQAPDGCGKCQYLSRYPGDDRANEAAAAHLGLQLIKMEAYLTGGNFLVDGHGAAFSTCAVVGENQPLMSEGQILELVRQLLGVERYHLLGWTEEYGIQHIDCWFKLLDPETMLVKRAPTDHPEHARVEANVAVLEKLTSSFGRPYRIVRIDCPRFRGDAIAAYTNSYILNDTVHVPLFGVAGDEEALDVYRRSMPGYRVFGCPWQGWREFDALHCRTRAVFDPHMIRMSHAPLRAPPPAPEPCEVAALIDDRSESGLVREALFVAWRRSGQADWTRVPFLEGGAPDFYQAVIPGQADGAAVEYYMHAQDESGRVATLPPSAPDGFYTIPAAGAPAHEKE
ncbi:MAG: agmatine deiminase family protein [Planctomycetes bacterium]|nr:agmatine deiminase family protein [Planctomycetota bacterium]